MSKGNNIDKLFRNSLKNQEFAYSGNSWGEMESMLNARSKRKAWVRFGSIAASVILLLSSTSFWYFNMQPNNALSENIAQIPSKNPDKLNQQNITTINDKMGIDKTTNTNSTQIIFY